MIQVIEQYHDYEPTNYYIDPIKLNPDNYVDLKIIEGLKKKSKKVRVFIDAHHWEDDPKFKEEPGVSGKARTKGKPIEERTIWLTIDFDG